MSTQGKYIVIEGPDGTGKTTQAKLLADTLRQKGIASKYVHEPGETAIGLELEKIIKNRSLERSALSDLLLFTVNRLELFQQNVGMALENGEVVIADRSWLSSIAYQGVAGGLGAATVADITHQFLPERYIYPDFTAVLYLSDERRKQLLGNRGTSGADYFETKAADFQAGIIKGYEIALQVANKNKHAPNKNIAAEGSIHEVHLRIIQALHEENILPR